MQAVPSLNSDPLLPFSSYGGNNLSISFVFPIWFTPAPYRTSSSRKPIHCAIKRRKRYVFGRSSKIMLESACIIASKIGLLPPPLALLMREFGGGNAGGGGGGFGDGFGWGDFDGWKRRKTRMRMVGVLLVCCLGLWVVWGKEIKFDADLVFRGLGLLLFGLSVNGWRKGVKDWILGFCCCAFLGCLVLKREDIQTWVKLFGTVNKNGRKKRRMF